MACSISGAAGCESRSVSPLLPGPVISSMSTRRTSARRTRTLWLSMPRLPRSTWESQARICRRARPVLLATGRVAALPARYAARPPRGPATSSGTGPDRERVDNPAPRREPALIRGFRVEQHPHAHPAQRVETRGERRVAGELRLAIRPDHDRDAVTGHLAQQAHSEVVRVAVGELVDAVERQRTCEHGIRLRDGCAGAWHPVLRTHRLASQPLQLGGIDEPGAGRRGEDHDPPPSGLAG